MRPTRRGVGVLAVAIAAVVMGVRFGQPGLNAVAGPLLVAVVAAAVQVRLAGTPTVERDPPRRGFPGDRRSVELTVEGSGIARLTDTVPEALGGASTVRRSLPTTVAYEVTYERRGEHRIGPVDVVLTDVLGLVRRATTVDVVDEVLVYPPVYRMGGPDAFARTLAPEPEDRQAFDRLREYVPGDSLRDVHWKSSAKRDELLVKEYDDHRSDDGILVVGEATPGTDDAMAAAVATVTMAALDGGVAVELAVPGGSVPAGFGDSHRTRLLEVLAVTSHGETDRAEDADVLVRADEDGVTVATDGRRHPFADVTTDTVAPLAGEGES
jgi:uncharacterized protein (DUF58 family)